MVFGGVFKQAEVRRLRGLWPTHEIIAGGRVQRCAIRRGRILVKDVRGVEQLHVDRQRCRALRNVLELCDAPRNVERGEQGDLAGGVDAVVAGDEFDAEDRRVRATPSSSERVPSSKRPPSFQFSDLPARSQRRTLSQDADFAGTAERGDDLLDASRAEDEPASSSESDAHF